MKRSRVVMIGLDAAEPSLIERWMGGGYLPNLAEIAASGCYGRLASSARHLALADVLHGDGPGPTPGRNPDGRSGNHRGDGFVLARGPDVAPGSTVAGGDILDLLPTLACPLEMEPRAEWEGKPLVPVTP